MLQRLIALYQDWVYWRKYGLRHRPRPMTREQWVERELTALNQLVEYGLLSDVPLTAGELMKMFLDSETWFCPVGLSYDALENAVDELEAQRGQSYRRTLGLPLSQMGDVVSLTNQRILGSKPKLVIRSGLSPDNSPVMNPEEFLTAPGFAELMYLILRWKMAGRSDLLARFSGCEFRSLTANELKEMTLRYGLPMPDNTEQVKYWVRVVAL